MDSVIEMNRVSKRYGETEALREIDLRVDGGEVVGFLGPNGAGKTTAIGIMLGLRAPTRGRVRLFGAPPRSRSARARVGVMLQESGVPDSLRVEELLRLFQATYPATLPTAEILERADLLASRRKLVGSLSGGQKQRLYFALALAGDPDVLFLDEPTAAMDVASRRLFWDQVREFASYGKTVLFSTHYLEEADQVADRIVVIDRGQIVAEGSPESIKALTAEKTVRLRTDVPADRARSLPGVQRAFRDGEHLVVFSNEPERFLAALFTAGAEVADLTVEETELEAAFVALTEGREGAAPDRHRKESVA